LIIILSSSAKESDATDLMNRFPDMPDSGIHYDGGRYVIHISKVCDSETASALEAHPLVERVVSIEAPYLRVASADGSARKVVKVGRIAFGEPHFTVIAGPCAIESEEQLMDTAVAVKAAGASVLRGGAYKPRTSPYAFQGMGEAGLVVLNEIGRKLDMPVVTEVMDPRDVELVGAYADMLQIGARNMQNSPLLKEVGSLGKPVLLKRHPMATYEEWLLAAEYIAATGNDQIVLCERGIRTFETYTRNTLDLASVAVIQQLSCLPVIVDPSHGCGRWKLVTPLTLASAAVGADGVMIEVHPNPEQALSDGPQSLHTERFSLLMDQLKIILPIMGRNLS